MTDDGRNLLTFSRLATYRVCPKRHWFAYERGIRPDRIGAPLRIGGAVHLGLDLMAIGVSRESAMVSAVAGYEHSPAWAVTDDDVREWEYERETVMRLLHAYSIYWADQGLVVVVSERPFARSIVDPYSGKVSAAFEHAGKIDKIVLLPDGREAVMEHKTTSDDIGCESPYWDRLRIDSQISGYMLAAESIGFDVRTVLYDVVRKPSIRPGDIPILDGEGRKIVLAPTGERVVTARGEPRQTGDAERGWTVQTRPMTAEEWGDRLSADISARPERYFARREIGRMDADLELAAHELWAESCLLAANQRLGVWPRNTAACLDPYPCPYRGLCFLGTEAEEGGRAPEGFIELPYVHPELCEVGK